MPSSWNSSSRPVEAPVVVGPGSRLGWEDVTADLFEDFRRYEEYECSFGTFLDLLGLTDEVRRAL